MLYPYNNKSYITAKPKVTLNKKISNEMKLRNALRKTFANVSLKEKLPC